MLPHLAEVSVRSIVLALAAAAILRILRRRSTAAQRHAVWTMVLAAMLMLLAIGRQFPRLPLRVLDNPAHPVQANVMPGGVTPESVPSLQPQFAAGGRSFDWRDALLCAYSLVALALLARLAAGMLLVRKLVAAARPLSPEGLDLAWESGRIAVPYLVVDSVSRPAN